jgi:hypothetical protein
VCISSDEVGDGRLDKVCNWNTLTDFEVAKTAWEQAQLNWNSAAIAVDITKHELMYACGYPHEMRL